MKIPAIFIIIPCMEGKMWYIRPYDIVNLMEGSNGLVGVAFKEGSDVKYMNTLLTAQEIHEKIIELEEANFKYTFGE
jgi:hypothetical protein